MDFVSQISHNLATQVDTFASHMGLGTRSDEAPGVHAHMPSSQSHESQLVDGQHHQEEEGPALPLIRIPEDVRPNMLAFLTATELSAVRRISRGFLYTADLHAETLWGHLCRRDFPSMDPGRDRYLPSHQQYVKNVLHRANDEIGNLRANHRLRESLDNYTWPIAWPAAGTATATTTKTVIYSAVSSAFGSNMNSSINRSGSSTSRSTCGVIGILADLVTVPDVRIARALSYKRRAALSTVIVDNDKVLFDFRRRGIHTGPVNFLPVSTLLLDNPTPLAPLLLPLLLPPPARNNAAAAVASNEDRFFNARGDGGAGLLPPAPEAPAPAGFLGYAVRLLQLRPEHEPLRWTVLYALFKDLAVFETTEQAEAVRTRVPDRRLFYCALDHPGAQADPCPPGGRPLPHISHWGFQQAPGGTGAGGCGGGQCGCSGGDEAPGEGRGAWETVGDATERHERTACFARSSLAFLQYGGGGVMAG